MLFCVVIIKAQNFPIPYKIERIYDECSACNAKTRSIWKLLSPESFTENIREAIDYKIFKEKTYPEKVSWYLKEQDSDKECELTSSGKHVWKNKIIYITDNMSKDFFTKYQNEQGIEKEKNKKELEEIKEQDRILEENNKKISLEYEKHLNILTENRNQASILIQKNDIENYLLIQEEVLNKWNELKNLNLDKTLRYRDTYSMYLNDIYSYTTNLLLMKQFEKAFNFLYEFLKDEDSFWSKNDNVSISSEHMFKEYIRAAGYDQDRFKIAINFSHSVMLANKEKICPWTSLEEIEKNDLLPNGFKEKWCEMTLKDYSKFEQLGLLQNIDLLKLKLSAWNGLSVYFSDYASYNTQDFVRSNDQNVAKYLKGLNINSLKIFPPSSFNPYCKFESKLLVVANNLYSFDFPYDTKGYCSGKKIFFYLSKNDHLIIVNSSKKDLSEKKMIKKVNESLEIRTKQLSLNNFK